MAVTKCYGLFNKGDKMKGLIYYDATLPVSPKCNICGRKCKDGMAWVYKEGDTMLFFCGDGVDCRDEFLELNQMEEG